jgi:hypothetical protein
LESAPLESTAASVIAAFPRDVVLGTLRGPAPFESAPSESTVACATAALPQDVVSSTLSGSFTSTAALPRDAVSDTPLSGSPRSQRLARALDCRFFSPLLCYSTAARIQWPDSLLLPEHLTLMPAAEP